MISPGEWADIRAAVENVTNRETDIEEPRGCSVERDPNGGITIVLNPASLDLEPEDEDIPDPPTIDDLPEALPANSDIMWCDRCGVHHGGECQEDDDFTVLGESPDPNWMNP